MKAFRTLNDVLRSPWADPSALTSPTRNTTDHVLRATKLEDCIYEELRAEDEEMERIESEASQKLKTFPALSRDVFQSFYSLSPRKTAEEELSATARKFNAQLLAHVTEQDEYPALKNICEGRELPAYDAALEFIARTAEDLDDLLPDLGGSKGTLNTLEKLEAAERQAKEELSGLLEQQATSGSASPTLENAIIQTANRAESKARQVSAVSKLADDALLRQKPQMAQILSEAVQVAAQKAEETNAILVSWSDDPGNKTRCPMNTELLERVRVNPALLEISKYLGRFREIFAQGKRNGYTYGRGENYSLELGNDLSRALTSELGMLATPETIPLFLRKYQRKQIKQYRRREPIRKGMGDIICCLDESGSTRGDAAAWGKAVAMTLLEIAADRCRSFALIHFSGPGSFQTDIFRPKEYSMEDKLRAAETFLGGGTDFETPMTEAVRLMEHEGFESADVVFITDGACSVTDELISQLRQAQTEQNFTITGILLDSNIPDMDFSLKSFCQKTYRTSMFTKDEIMKQIVCNRV